ncbi:methyltransferase [Candidatus Woesearchaeota archaeon]|jgi:putative methylase|nr:methyltransferase [Candidatus Woesearchaeota archaeon]MBT6044703.1 methyltransferase [Candidatus Woesearchaeota archaeon]
MKKKDVEIILSGLATFEKQHLDLEQYQTESHIAADLLWHAFMSGDIEKKVIADLGCGNGVFGIGALLLGAKEVLFLDVDGDAIKVARANVLAVERIVGKKLSKSFSHSDVNKFSKKVDTVIQNPPFGVRKTHADKPFLLRAMKNSSRIYSFHKLDTARFVESFVKDEGWGVRLVKKYKFPLRKGKNGVKKGYAFWKKNVHYVDVGVWLIDSEVV